MSNPVIKRKLYLLLDLVMSVQFTQESQSRAVHLLGPHRTFALRYAHVLRGGAVCATIQHVGTDLNVYWFLTSLEAVLDACSILVSLSCLPEPNSQRVSALQTCIQVYIYVYSHYKISCQLHKDKHLVLDVITKTPYNWWGVDWWLLTCRTMMWPGKMHSRPSDWCTTSQWRAKSSHQDSQGYARLPQ